MADTWSEPGGYLQWDEVDFGGVYVNSPPSNVSCQALGDLISKAHSYFESSRGTTLGYQNSSPQALCVITADASKVGTRARNVVSTTWLVYSRGYFCANQGRYCAPMDHTTLDGVGGVHSAS